MSKMVKPIGPIPPAPAWFKEMRLQKNSLYEPLKNLVEVLRERHYGRMPKEVQDAYDAANMALKGCASQKGSE